MATRIKAHIDPKGYDEKPSGKEIGGIKTRLQKKSSPSFVTLEELVQKIKTGHSISPGIMGGMSAKDWKEQQLFMVDIDNEEEGPILRIKGAKAICRDNNLPLAFYYQTFSYTKEHPKFRLGFVMDKPVRDEGMRKHIMEALVNLFPQSDKSCVNADRIFHGTNKTAKLFNENARISWENIEAVTFPTRPAEHHTDHSNHTEMRSDSELNELVQSFDFFGYLKERNGGFRRTSKGAVFHNCEICGHHDNLMYVAETNTFCCRSENKGGSIIDYLKYTEGLTTAQAIDKLKNELCEPRWSTPIPLDSVKLPVFPVKALPRPLREWVTAVAESTQTPVDMAAVCALAILSCALQGKFKVAQNRSHSEPLNLYILIIAKSGERKSSVVRTMAKVIYQFEDEENARRRLKMEKEEAELSALKKQLDQYDKAGKTNAAYEIRLQIKEKERKKTKPIRLLADDVTPEALTTLLADNRGILSIISTEGGLFDTLSGRYSNMISIGTVLKAYTGDRIRVDRKGRESETVNEPALTMLLSAQDNVLEGLMKNEVFRNRGLPARILYSRPASRVGSRKYKVPELPAKLEAEYFKLILDLLNISPGTQAGELRLDSEADECAKQYFEALEARLVGDLSSIDDWGGKHFGNMLRIAGLIHCAKPPTAPSAYLISRDTIEQAIKISRYFLEHAKFAYSQLGADKTLRGARMVLKRLEEQDKRELTKYQILRLCRSEFSKVDDVVPVIELLIEYGYLKERTYSAPTGGRPRGNGYLLNPLFFDK